MNTSSITHAIADHVPSRSAAASTISSTLDEISDHLPDIDVSGAARRTRRTMKRVVPGMSEPRSHSTRWLLITGAIVAVIAAIVVVRRRSDEDAGPRRDDWSVPTDGDSPSSDVATGERAAAHV